MCVLIDMHQIQMSVHGKYFTIERINNKIKPFSMNCKFSEICIRPFLQLKVLVTIKFLVKQKVTETVGGTLTQVYLRFRSERRRAIKNLLNVFVRVGSETDLEVNPSPDAAIKGPAGQPSRLWQRMYRDLHERVITCRSSLAN